MPDLESMTGDAFARIDEKLGNTMTVTPQGGSPVTFKGNVDFGEDVLDFGGPGARAVAQTMTADYAMTWVAGKPGKGWRVTFAAIAGRTFEPLNARADETGSRWVFELKELPA
jgi:hypothetical protein